jgi:hypothetical protein
MRRDPRSGEVRSFSVLRAAFVVKAAARAAIRWIGHDGPASAEGAVSQRDSAVSPASAEGAVSCRLMATSFAALVYRTAEIPDRALARGFAVALAGWDVPSPRLLVAPLPGLPEWSAAFYASGARGDDAIDHAIELFDEDLSPAEAVLDAAEEGGHPGATLYAVVYSEEMNHDDVCRFDARGFERRFVREGDLAIEAGVETAEGSEVTEVDLDPTANGGIEDEDTAVEEAIRPLRGTAFLSRELSAPALPALMGALFAPERKILARLCDPSPEAVAEEARRLDRALGRVPGRGAFVAPPTIGGVAAPAAYLAFAAVYDWADPSDPGDRYRELAIGAVEGTLRFLREADLQALDRDPAWAAAAEAGLYPVARLEGSALGGKGGGALIALGADGERLALVRAGKIAEAGPTLGELLLYLALGWSKRSEVEEDLIGALMLRAHLRSGAGA